MRIKLVLLAIAGLFAIQSAVAEEGLTVSDAWVREGPPAATALGGFMVIHNHSDKARALVRASSAGFGMVELHRSIQQDGMMKMIQQEKIVIPAKGSLAFKPGDYHIMLMKPKQAYQAGDHVTITLGFADGSEVKVKYTVRKGQGMDHGQHNMNHGGHNMSHKQH